MAPQDVASPGKARRARIPSPASALLLVGLVLIMLGLAAVAGRPVAAQAQPGSAASMLHLVGWSLDAASPGALQDAFGEELIAAFGWDAGARRFRGHFPTAPAALQTLGRLAPGQGLIVRLGSADTSPLPRARPDPAAVLTLQAGHNLVAWLGADRVSLANAIASIRADLVSVTVQDATTGRLRTFAGAGLVGSATAVRLRTGDGVWVQMSRAVQWRQGAPRVPVVERRSLNGLEIDLPTQLQFGPDGRLCVTQQDGLIQALHLARDESGQYHVTATESITLVQDLPNHNDDGSVTGVPRHARQVTGLHVARTAQHPVLDVSSSDPRIALHYDSGLDTNSGVISRLTWDGVRWRHEQLLRGLPRSEENLASNGLVLDEGTGTLFIAQGSNTNLGAPSQLFGFLPQYAWSCAILALYLEHSALREPPYDLPTLGGQGPFGGANGLNQAMLDPGGPLRIHAPGFRNPYDLVLTRAGQLFTIDNGPNLGWGAPPAGEGTTSCRNDPQGDGAVGWGDSLHRVARGDYGGHPNPTRGNRDNLFGGRSPAHTSNARECRLLAPRENGALTTFPASTNGMVEYVASNFAGALRGDLLAASHSNSVQRVWLTADGAGVVEARTLLPGVGALPLTIATQADGAAFPGTIWVADHQADAVIVYEPADFDRRAWRRVRPDDTDGDGYNDAAERAAGSDPASIFSTPADADGDLTPDHVDPDDDNDGRPDVADPLLLDAANGLRTILPVHLSWDGRDLAVPGLLATGFVGVAPTASGATRIPDADQVLIDRGQGTLTLLPAIEPIALALGIPLDERAPVFTLHARIRVPAMQPGRWSAGIHLGAGEMGRVHSLQLAAVNGGLAIIVDSGTLDRAQPDPVSTPNSDAPFVDLYLTVDLRRGFVQPAYVLADGPLVREGPPFALPPTATREGALVVGVVASAAASGIPVALIWDVFEVTIGAPADRTGVWRTWTTAPLQTRTATYVAIEDQFIFSAGGEQWHFDPASATWTPAAPLPLGINNVQAVAIGRRIYYVGRFLEGTNEPSAAILIYDAAKNSVEQGQPMPAGRARGAAGVVAHDGKIYVIGGFRDGQASPFVDVYDTATASWQALPDLTLPREHFQAALVGHVIYAIGGRDGPLNATLASMESLDLRAGSDAAWTLTSLDAGDFTPRSAFMVAVLDGEILTIGGVGGGRALGVVEAYDPATDTWRRLAAMHSPRHHTQAVVWRSGISIAAGGRTEPPLNPSAIHDVLKFSPAAP